MKQANFEYIKKEEIEFLGKEVGDRFITPEKNVAGYESINAELLCCTPYKEWVKGAVYASLCTWDAEPTKPVTELLNSSFKEQEKLLINILKQRPISVALEGSTFIFKLSGIPRSMTHQIVRHRQMSFGQQSFRVSSCYSDAVRIPNMEMHLQDKYDLTVKMCRELYKEMIEEGIPMEQARNIMPMGTTTKITITMRFRELLDYLKNRTLDIAQDEHTYIVARIINEVKNKAPKYYRLLEVMAPNALDKLKNYR